MNQTQLDALTTDPHARHQLELHLKDGGDIIRYELLATTEDTNDKSIRNLREVMAAKVQGLDQLRILYDQCKKAKIANKLINADTALNNVARSARVCGWARLATTQDKAETLATYMEDKIRNIAKKAKNPYQANSTLHQALSI